MTKDINIFLKIVFTLLFMSAVALFSAKAQFLDSRLNIYAALSTGVFQGDHWVDSDGLITPSLYANMSRTTGVSSYVTYDVHEWIAATFHVSAHSAGNWDHPESRLYQNADIRYYYFAPGLRLQSPYRKLGLLNRGRLFAGVSYGSGYTMLDLASPVMIIRPGQGERPGQAELRSPYRETTFFHGWKATAGFQFTISHSIGLYASYSLHSNRINGSLFTDSGFKAGLLEAGLFLRFMENRRYYL